MIDAHLFSQLRHASKVFRKQGCHRLADDCISLLLDTISPDRAEAQRLIHLALGGTIHA